MTQGLLHHKPMIYSPSVVLTAKGALSNLTFIDLATVVLHYLSKECHLYLRWSVTANKKRSQTFRSESSMMNNRDQSTNTSSLKRKGEKQSVRKWQSKWVNDKDKKREMWKACPHNARWTDKSSGAGCDSFPVPSNILTNLKTGLCCEGFHFKYFDKAYLRH